MLWSQYYLGKPEKDRATEIENYRSNFLISKDAKILNKILQSEFKNILKRPFTMIKPVSF